MEGANLLKRLNDQDDEVKVESKDRADPQITRAAGACRSIRSGLEQTLDLRIEIHGDREC